MRCGYLDCFSGVAGNMILGALLDAGLPVQVLNDTVARLGLEGVTLKVERVARGGLAATHVVVDTGSQVGRHHRHLPEILQMIAGAQLPARVADRATRIFRRLAEAEAGVHGIDVDQVHFHEVGAADAIVDIVGACTGFETLGLERLFSSPIPTGSGTVTCAHGILPVPAPATAALLRGVPLASSDEVGELTTPTGAAIVTTLAEQFGPLPGMTIRAIGYGAGTRENRARPNVLRLIVGDLPENDSRPDMEHDQVVVLETQVDDVPAQILAFTTQRLLDAGALDAFLVPIIMKKGRPGHLLTVLARPQDVPILEDVLFAETGTLGVRRQEGLRSKLGRRHVTVSTRFGPIRVKLGLRGQRVVQVWPEYEDCAAAADATGASLRDVQAAALDAWMREHGGRNERTD